MAGGSNADSRSLEHTPTWAVAIVCLAIVLISISIEQFIHFISKWLKKRRKKALGEALEKIKAELMLLGFISLLLTVGQTSISKICISKRLGETFLPCSKKAFSVQSQKLPLVVEHHRKLQLFPLDQIETRRTLATEDPDQMGHCAEQGKVPLISQDGLHQLHIFIFVLGVCHVLSCVMTMALGWVKMKKWKAWEEDAKSDFFIDPQRFRFTRETTYGRRHLSFWSTKPILTWIVCFYRQFLRSVLKVDYLTLRHGFILAHFSPHTGFNFQRYIKRSLSEDFSTIASISPHLWIFAILFLLLSQHGDFTLYWLSCIPLIILLIVGTKLQVIITKMALDIQDRSSVVQGAPVVKPNDQLFWFGKPRFILHLIHFTLFETAFQIAFFFWTWYEYGLSSCFNEKVQGTILKVATGVGAQILCSYVTLPLYALVTQMGSNMRTAIFDEKIADSLKKWHLRAKKNIRKNVKKNREDLSNSQANSSGLFNKYRDEYELSDSASSSFRGENNSKVKLHEESQGVEMKE